MEDKRERKTINEDGGVRETNSYKGLFYCMSTAGLRRLSARYKYGFIKYGASDNYKKGLPASDCIDSCFRHLVAYLEGDNSEDHLAAVAWNAFCIMEMECNNPKYCNITTRQDIKPEECMADYYLDIAYRNMKKDEEETK